MGLSDDPVPFRPDQYAEGGVSRRTGGAISGDDILRNGVSAQQLYEAYPEEGMRFYRGMRVSRDEEGRLQIFEQRPTEAGGERLQNGILNFSQDPEVARGFAERPGGNAFDGDARVLLETRPIPREEALQRFHSDNFNPSIFADGLSTTDKWDMRSDTRLPEVVDRVHVLDPETGQYRPARPGEVSWVDPQGARRTDDGAGPRPVDAPQDPRAQDPGRPPTTTAGDPGGGGGGGPSCATCGSPTSGGVGAGEAPAAAAAAGDAPPSADGPPRPADGPPRPADAGSSFDRAQRTPGSQSRDGYIYGVSDDGALNYRFNADGSFAGTVPNSAVPNDAAMGVTDQLGRMAYPDAPGVRFVDAPDGRRYALTREGIAVAEGDRLRLLDPAQRAALPREVQNPILMRAAGPTLATPDGYNAMYAARARTVGSMVDWAQNQNDAAAAGLPIGGENVGRRVDSRRQ